MHKISAKSSQCLRRRDENREHVHPHLHERISEDFYYLTVSYPLTSQTNFVSLRSLPIRRTNSVPVSQSKELRLKSKVRFLLCAARASGRFEISFSPSSLAWPWPVAVSFHVSKSNNLRAEEKSRAGGGEGMSNFIMTSSHYHYAHYQKKHEPFSVSHILSLFNSTPAINPFSLLAL